jgi:hypothetical protein
MTLTSGALLLTYVNVVILNHILICRQKIVKNYGVIECDPLVRMGLDKTVS